MVSVFYFASGALIGYIVAVIVIWQLLKATPTETSAPPKPVKDRPDCKDFGITGSMQHYADYIPHKNGHHLIFRQ